MNRGRDMAPFDEADDEGVDRTMVARSGLSVEATVVRRPAPAIAPLDDPDALDRTMMASRRSILLPDATMARQPDPPTDGTIVVARSSGPPSDGTVMVTRRADPPTDGTIVVARTSGPPTDGTVVVRQSGPSTDGTVVVRPGRPSGGAAMADPVLRGRARQKNVAKPPPSIHEERPRYTPRLIPPPPGPPLQIMEGPTALRGTAPMPSVAAASRRTARFALGVWLALSVVCTVGVVWCATQLFGG